MKNNRAFIALASVLLVVGPTSYSCKLSATDDACLARYTNEELNAYPKLRQRNVTLYEDVRNGQVTLELSWSRNPAPFREETLSAIRNGRDLRDIQTFTDSSVDVLIEAEEIIRRIPRVKSVTWKADEPFEGYQRTRASGTNLEWKSCPDR